MSKLDLVARITRRGSVPLVVFIALGGALSCSGDSATGPVPAPTPTQLHLITQASGATSGASFSVQPVGEIRDARGDRVTGSAAGVTMIVNSGPTVIGAATVNAVAGVATFSNVGLSGIVGTYTLSFTSAGLSAATHTIDLTHGTPTQVVLSTPAAGAAAGTAFATQPVASIRDAAGNVVATSTAGVTLTASTGATVTGTATVNAVAGTATFTDAGLSGPAGAYTLTFAASGLNSATQPLQVTAGATSQLVLTTQPGTATSGAAFGAQPVVSLRDAFGSVVQTGSLTVTATVSSGSGALLGTAT